jgi:hypothetical protein
MKFLSLRLTSGRMLILCLKESSYEIPETVKKAKNIVNVNTAAVGSAIKWSVRYR